jgi:hypothetical protein
MTQNGEFAFTVFRFDCCACGLPNEYVHRHRPSVVPHLISTACHHCQVVNQLGGLTGARVEPKVFENGTVVLDVDADRR